MKALYTFIISLMLSPLCYGQLTITEISYNPPESGSDSLEYVELLNTSGGNLDITGWRFSQGISLVFDQLTLEPDEYLIVAGDSIAMMSVLGIESIEFSGALTNDGETLEILDANGSVVDIVEYSDRGIWPSDDEGTDGMGASIELCDISADNNDGSNWRAADSDTGATADGRSYLGTPAYPNSVSCMEVTYPDTPISILTDVDINGNLTYAGGTASVTATVYGVNLNSNGLQFFLIDETNEGIAVYSSSETFGYSVAEGDLVTVDGALEQFNGLAQLIPVSISLVSQGVILIDPLVVESLDEATESSLIRLENMTLSAESQWLPGTDSGFNTDFMNPDGNVISVRIDNEVELFNTSVDFINPNSTYTITGIGSQYDSSDPALEGYQLVPRYNADIQEVISNTLEILDANAVEIFPNPVSVSMTLEISNNIPIVSTSIVNSQGSVVYMDDTGAIVHLLDELLAGVYIVQIRTTKGMYLKQMTKM